MKRISFNRVSSVFLIIGATAVSWLIANIGINYERLELGALTIRFVPLICGGLTLVLFYVVDWVAPELRFWTTTLFVAAQIICGIVLRCTST